MLFLKINKLYNLLLLAGPKDTVPEDLEAETFKAKYKTFEQDLIDEYGLTESGERAPTYVY